MSTITVTNATIKGADIAGGLRIVAALFECGDVPPMTHPSLPLSVEVSLTTETAVREFAARFDVPVRQNEHQGRLHTNFDAPLGGVDLHVYHIGGAL